MRYLVLENILLKEEEVIIKTGAGVPRLKVINKERAGGVAHTIKDLEDFSEVGIKYEEDGDVTRIHYSVNSVLVGTSTITKDQLGKPVEIEMYDDKDMRSRGVLADHNLTILQDNKILARIDNKMFNPEPTYVINVEDNNKKYDVLLIAICASFDKFIQEHAGSDDHRRRLFGTRN